MSIPNHQSIKRLTSKFYLSNFFYHLLSCILFIFLITSNVYAQKKSANWQSIFNGTAANFYDLQESFEKAENKQEKINRKKIKRGEKVGESPGFEVFERWAEYMGPRVYPTGNITLPSTAFENYMEWLKTYSTPNVALQTSELQQTQRPTDANWTQLGPFGSPTGPAPYSGTGAGRLNFVTFHPTDINTYFVGAADGGLWKTTNSGASWATNTDFLTIIGTADLKINPTNTMIMYLATGDREGDKASRGVLKSNDGGNTWTNTSMVFMPTQNVRIVQMAMNPANPLNMLIATSEGIFKTTDGWASRVLVQAGSFKEIAFKPNDPTTIYASGTEVLTSNDNGVTWVVSAGLPNSNLVVRIALAVTIADPTIVYALCGKASNNSFLGLYRSTNSGVSFSLMSNSPNVLGYDGDGMDLTSGQAFYDLAIVASPTNANIITTGGINHWQSYNGGVNWTNLSVWNAGPVHADIHYLAYLPGSSSVMFSCNDGGIFKSTTNGTNFVDITNNLAIAQTVGIGLSKFTPNKLVAGTQDNGTNVKTAALWNNVFGGDGGDCFYGSKTTNDTLFIQYVSGGFYRSVDGGANFDTLTVGMSGKFDFYSNWIQDPVNSNILYVGGNKNLYKSINKGSNWTTIGNLSGNIGTVKGIAVPASNNSVVYVIKTNKVFKSVNGAVDFVDVTGSLPVANAELTSIDVSNINQETIWVTFSGYSDGEKVFKSINGGTTWTNISAGLPNIPMNKVLSVNNSLSNAIYLGADIGVYYMSNVTPLQLYNLALPNVAVRDLEIQYTSGKLTAATFGRGVWQTDTFAVAALPVKFIKFDGQNQNEKNILNWKVQEANTAKYFIEKSTDGQNFNHVGSVLSIGDGENTYNYTDVATINGADYYRIKQQDVNGTNTFSSILKLNNRQQNSVSVYPNPVKDFAVISGGTIGSKVMITNIEGKQLQLINVTSSVFTLDLTKYSRGVYILKFEDGKIVRLIKE